MNKKGQFFLVAALIIVGIIVSLGVIHVATKSASREEAKVYDLSEEIDYESNEVINYGVFRAKSPGEIMGNLTQLSTFYSQANPSTTIIIIYGNSSRFYGRYYGAPTGNIGTSFGGGSLGLPAYDTSGTEISSNDITVSQERQVLVRMPNATVQFRLRPGENFFIVLQQKQGGEEIVAKTE